jgi:dienelactone hydrolase
MKQLFTILLLTIATVAMGQYKLTESKVQSFNLATFTPPNYNPLKKYPAIIFLHGRGEDGNGVNDIKRLYNNGMALVLKRGYTPPQEYIIFCPQANWGRLLNPQLEAVYADLMKNYPVDTNRVFLTGLSFGAQTSIEATLDNSKEFTKKFAAIIPFSPPVTPKKDITFLKEIKTPFWLLAGTQSADLNYRQNAEATANLINAQVPSLAKLSLALNIGHGGSFTSLYDGTFRDGVNFWEYIANIKTPTPPNPPTPPVILTVTKAYHDSVVNVLQSKLNNIKVIVNN